jgi:hypothetical protein
VIPGPMTDFEHSYERHLRRALGLADEASADDVLKTLGRIQRHGFQVIDAEIATKELIAAFKLGVDAAAHQVRLLVDSGDLISDERLARVLGEKLNSALIDTDNA